VIVASIVFGVVQKPVEAQRIVEQLVQHCLCDRSDISVMLRDSAQTSNSQALASTVTKAVDTTAAAAASVFGGVFAGMNAISRAIPGGGMLRAVGAVGDALVNAGLGTAAGVTKALVEAGLPKEHAKYYGDAFERGGILIRVEAKTDSIGMCARKIMMQHGAVAPENQPTH
jgi:hypothetical protein